MAEEQMTSEVDILSDRDGIAIFGSGHDIDLFLSTAGLESRDLSRNQNFAGLMAKASGLTQTGSLISENSGRWIKVTKETAKSMKTLTPMKGSSNGVSKAILTSNGKTAKIVEFIDPKKVGSLLTNPALLAGAAGILSQMAMQETLEKITEYLELIDEKLDDVLRAQKDAAISQLIGVGSSIDEAMTIRREVGRVSDVTWSKIQQSSQILHQCQAYALLQLDGIATKIEKKTKVADLWKSTGEAEIKVAEWLTVLARTFQLQDSLAILELDRVFDESPTELDKHRIALQIARKNRREQIEASTRRLMQRLDAAAQIANSQVLLHPVKAAAVIQAGNKIGQNISTFSERVGLEIERDSLDSKRWRVAASEARDKAVDVGIEGAKKAKKLSSKAVDGAAEIGAGAIESAAKLGADALGGAKSGAKKASAKISRTLGRLRADD